LNRILLLADDLTGALDAAAVLRRQQWSASVVLAQEEYPAGSVGDPDVLAVTTETRHVENPDAALREVASALPRDRLVYKKIDSTLRGLFGLEIATLLEVFGGETALVVPALPGQGRAILGGELLVNGVPQDTNLVSLLRQQSAGKVVHVPLEQVRSGLEELATMLARPVGMGPAFVAVDAVTDDDLVLIARAVQRLSSPMLIAGSAGFAAHLPTAWGLSRRTVTPEAAPSSNGSRTSVIGSANPKTLAQVELLCAAGVEQIVLDPEMVDQAGMESLAEQGKAWLRRGVDVVVRLAPPSRLSLAATPAERQLRSARMLGGLGAGLVHHTSARTLILSGGDVAYAVCRALGVTTIVLDGEILPGLPLGHARTSTGERVTLITKAGGFGADDALCMARALPRPNIVASDGRLASPQRKHHDETF
jgi:D-threonate/D-erythronate kinase